MTKNSNIIVLAYLCIVLRALSAPLDTALGKLAGDIATAPSMAPIRKISVVDFSDLRGDSNELCRYMAEELSVSLVNSGGKFAVLDRANLRTILKEHQLTTAGLVDPNNAKKLGEFAGVDGIVLGTVVQVGGEYSITAKVVSVETTAVVVAARVSAERDPAYDELWTKGLSGGDAFRESSHLGSGSTRDVRFDDIIIRLRSFQIGPDGIAKIILEITRNGPSRRMLYAINMRNRPGERLYCLDLFDEHGSFSRVITIGGARGAGSNGRDYNGDSYMLMKEFLQRGNLDEVDAYLPSFLEATDEPSIITIDMSKVDQQIGTRFRFQIEFISLVCSPGRHYEVRLNNVLFDGLTLGN